MFFSLFIPQLTSNHNYGYKEKEGMKELGLNSVGELPGERSVN